MGKQERKKQSTEGVNKKEKASALSFRGPAVGDLTVALRSQGGLLGS